MTAPKKAPAKKVSAAEAASKKRATEMAAATSTVVVTVADVTSPLEQAVEALNARNRDLEAMVRKLRSDARAVLGAFLAPPVLSFSSSPSSTLAARADERLALADRLEKLLRGDQG